MAVSTGAPLLGVRCGHHGPTPSLSPGFHIRPLCSLHDLNPTRTRGSVTPCDLPYGLSQQADLSQGTKGMQRDNKLGQQGGEIPRRVPMPDSP